MHREDLRSVVQPLCARRLGTSTTVSDTVYCSQGFPSKAWHCASRFDESMELCGIVVLLARQGLGKG